MRAAALGLILLAAAVTVWAVTSGAWSELRGWAAGAQRAFQTDMAGTIRAIRAGDGTALGALLAACFGYGVVHAIGPGHGKVLIGGASVATAAGHLRMVALAVVSSLAQAGTAILAVYGGLSLFAVTSRQIVGTTEQYLAPASFALIAGVGLLLAVRGMRHLGPAPAQPHRHLHAEDACCGHAHAPTAEQVNALRNPRDVALLIGAIAIRPCSGALLVLAIAWSMDLLLAGALAAIAMGLGTALFTSGVALGGVTFRAALARAAGQRGWLSRTLPLVQVAAGLLVLLAGSLMLTASL